MINHTILGFITTHGRETKMTYTYISNKFIPLTKVKTYFIMSPHYIQLLCCSVMLLQLNILTLHLLICHMFFKTEIRVSSAAIECMSCRDSPSIEECKKTTIKCTDDQVKQNQQVSMSFSTTSPVHVLFY